VAQDLEGLKKWIGEKETDVDYVTIPSVYRLAATLDRDDPMPKFGDALPIGWHWSSVGSFSYHSSYGTSTKCAHEPNGPPVLRIPNIQSGRIDKSDLKYAVTQRGILNATLYVLAIFCVSARMAALP